jgi:hypothetical protein
MRVSRIALVLLAALTLSLFFAFPAEDVPETAQDESESLPYETTPFLSCVLVEESATALSVVPIDQSDSRPALRYVAVRAELSWHPNLCSLTILDHTLRC